MLRASFATLALLVFNCAAHAERDAAHTFALEVRPILSTHCFQCHGPDEAHRKAGLRLDERESVFGGEEGETPVVLGNAEASHLWQRLTAEDPDERMPPLETGKVLTDAELKTLKSWIENGAAWSEHWSFVKPVKAALPDVRDTAWVKSPLDYFILEKIEAAGLHPATEASPAALLRRVSLDLTGLPPTPEELKAYLEDKSADAYEKAVDRLLASPRYGERWARVWLDLARYADTKGYEKDLGRTMWPYRDWVIRAFNEDMPYDQFTREQLAGDLLPDAREDQKVATAFHRNTMSNDEGGTDDEEFRSVAVKDRADTTGQVWMGLSVGCAKCHSHKYDPVSIKDYYAFYAFFNQTEDADRFDEMPLLETPTFEEKFKRNALKKEIDALEEIQNGILATETFKKEQRAWEARVQLEKTWTHLRAESANSETGLTLQPQDDASILVSGDQFAQDTYTVTVKPGAGAITALRLEALADDSLPGKGPGYSPEGNFVLSHFTATAHQGGESNELTFSAAYADYSQVGYEIEKSIAEGDHTQKGWAVSNQFGKDHQAYFVLGAPFAADESTTLEIKLEHRFSQAAFLLGRFRLSLTNTSDGLDTLNVPEDIAAIAAKPERNRSSEEQDRVARYYAKQGAVNASVRDKIAALRTDYNAIPLTRIPVMRELSDDKKRITRIHERGNFLSPGEEVQAAVLPAFPPMPEGAQLNRLGIADWLCNTENPLTARVAVNRYWAQFFGVGIVETEENFGSQGSMPTHPELLDWLAVDFMENGWSFKKLCRTIVLSATYRQDSATTPEKLAVDPRNLLLSRAPRIRLDAETVRDNALAVAGLLSAKMFGPSVMPPQPEGIWQSTYNTAKWETSAGEDRYRRGVYTYVKRTSPYPSMLTFDAPTREICAARRIRTNTPLQALVTLNDPVYIEAAQAFARRIIAEGGTDTASRVAFAFEAALARRPNTAEFETVEKLLASRHEHYAAAPNEAALMATEPLGAVPEGADVAELAAWTAVCNVLLNLDEVLMKG